MSRMDAPHVYICAFSSLHLELTTFMKNTERYVCSVVFTKLYLLKEELGGDRNLVMRWNICMVKVQSSM